MKKIIALLGAVCLLSTPVPLMQETEGNFACLTACAEEADGKIGVLTYHKYEDCVKITGCDANVENVEIPAEIEGLPVTIIGEEAFWESAVVSVTLPDCMEIIENSAFYWCRNLKKIEIPASVTQIGTDAFFECENLEEVILHEGLEKLNTQSFNGTALKNVEIPSTVNHFGYDVFGETPFWEQKTDETPLVIYNHILVDGKKCTGAVVIPEDVTVINMFSFNLNDTITSVKIPDTVQEIGDDAFTDCIKLEEVTLPNTITQIPIGAFENTGLKSVTIPESVQSIRSSAFAYCPNLEEVIFPDHQVDIYSTVFQDTPWLAKKQAENPLVIVNGTLIDGHTCTGDVIIPDDVTIISARAFDWNPNITSVVIPAGVREIWDETFTNCEKLNSVEMTGVEYIGPSAFSACRKLEQMKVSRRLRTISDYAFEKCPTRGIISYSGTEEQWQEIAKGIDNLFIRISEVQYGIAGDADGDGKVSVKDAVALQKWLLHMSGAKLRDCDLADLDENGIINIYDFCLLKRKLLHQK